MPEFPSEPTIQTANTARAPETRRHTPRARALGRTMLNAIAREQPVQAVLDIYEFFRFFAVPAMARGELLDEVVIPNTNFWLDRRNALLDYHSKRTDGLSKERAAYRATIDERHGADWPEQGRLTLAALCAESML